MISNRWLTRLPWLIAVGLVGCWAIVILIDMLNFAGIGTRLAERGRPIFVPLFTDGRPVEWLQWSCLILSCIIAAQLSVMENLRGRPDRAGFFIIFAFFFAILLLEEAADLRYIISDFIDALLAVEERQGSYKTIVYFAYALIPAYAVLKYGGFLFAKREINVLFWGGALAYAVAAMMSASSGVGDWYTVVGGTLNEFLFDGRVVERGTMTAGEWIMDLLIEETIELTGGILFVAYFARYRSRFNIEKLRERTLV